MPGRRGRQRLTMRKCSRAAATSKHREDDNEPTVPDDAKWRTLAPYGLCTINGEDGTKYRFKRGDVTTILPRHKAPGDHIEPHEYWVGKILEIRADARSEDSRMPSLRRSEGAYLPSQIWAKVQWFYNAQEAASMVKSLDTSHIGRFERLVSSHWDFVLPHTFNEVVPMPILHPYPFLKHKKSRSKRLTLGIGQHVDTEPVSIATTSTIVTDGELELGLEDQVPIEPETFYWRYTIDGKKLDPKQGLKSCLCSLPYSPDVTSLLKGVMFFCPRQTCRTSFHVGCLRDAKSIWVPDDQEVIIPTPRRSPLESSGRGRNVDRRRRTRIITGKSKGEKIEEKQAFADVQWLTPRAMGRITCTPDSGDSLDLLSFFSSSPTISASTPHKNHRQKSSLLTTSPSPIMSLLQRVYARQLQHHRYLRGLSMTSRCSSTHSVSSVMSTMSVGRWIDVEDLSVTEDEYDDIDIDVSMQYGTSAANCIREDICDTSESGDGISGGSCLFRGTVPQLTAPKLVSKSISKLKPRPKSLAREKKRLKQVQTEVPSTAMIPHIKPLTPIALLATLFLLPSPFPPSYASAICSQSTMNISTTHSSAIPPTTLTSNISSAGPNSKPVSSSMGVSDMTTDSKDLLLLASQPLIRGAGYIPCLGPTGNVNLVLAARRLIWETLSAVGRLELFTDPILAASGLKKCSRQPKAKGSKPAFAPLLVGTGDGDIHRDERELDDTQQYIRDAEDFRKVSECVFSVIGDWKKRMKEEERALPPSVEVDDGIIVNEGLFDDELPNGVSNENSVAGGEKKEDGDEDNEIHDGTTYEKEMEVGTLRSGKKRKQLDGTFRGGLRKKQKGKGKEKNRQEDEVREEQDLILEEEMLRVDWACPSCGNLL